MTTPLQTLPVWQGKSVAIFNIVPNTAAVDQPKCDVTIVLGSATKALWADMLIELDPASPIWQEAHDFKGLKICGIDTEQVDAVYVGLCYENIQIAEGNTLQIRHNILAALRFASNCGAARITLFGCKDVADFEGLTEGITQITAELQALGLVVEYAAVTAPAAAAVKPAKK
jgi:hypothetical protein